MSYLFIAHPAPHACRRLGNETAFIEERLNINHTNINIHYDECAIRIEVNTSTQDNYLDQYTFNCLNGYHFYEKEHTTLLGEWDLVCENTTWMVPFIQSVMMFGQSLGAIILASVADKKGRKPVIVASQLGTLLSGVIGAYAPNILVLIIARFFTGFFQVTLNMLLHNTLPV